MTFFCPIGGWCGGAPLVAKDVENKQVQSFVVLFTPRSNWLLFPNNCVLDVKMFGMEFIQVAGFLGFLSEHRVLRTIHQF